MDVRGPEAVGIPLLRGIAENMLGARTDEGKAEGDGIGFPDYAVDAVDEFGQTPLRSDQFAIGFVLRGTGLGMHELSVRIYIIG